MIITTVSQNRKKRNLKQKRFRFFLVCTHKMLWVALASWSTAIKFSIKMHKYILGDTAISKQEKMYLNSNKNAKCFPTPLKYGLADRVPHVKANSLGKQLLNRIKIYHLYFINIVIR